MRQRARPAVPDNAVVVEDLLELGGSFFALPDSEIGLAAYVGRVEAGDVGGEVDLAELDWGDDRLQIAVGFGRVLAVERQLRTNRGQPVRLHLRMQREPFVEVLRERFGSRCISRHGKGKGGFHLYRPTRGIKH